MPLNSIAKRFACKIQASLIISVLLCGCSHQKSPFTIHYLQTGDARFDAAKLCFYPQNPQRELALEFCQTSDGLKIFLILQSKRLNDSKSTVVILSETGCKESFTAYVHEGGQKLLASPSLKEALLKKLNEPSPLTIHCAGYKTTLNPASFMKAFARLDKIPIDLPIQIGLE